MTLDERVFERAGRRLHSWVGGASGGSPVDFTHGATIDHREWVLQRELMTFLDLHPAHPGTME